MTDLFSGFLGRLIDLLGVEGFLFVVALLVLWVLFEVWDRAGRN